jgi:hypothetical protein
MKIFSEFLLPILGSDRTYFRPKNEFLDPISLSGSILRVVKIKTGWNYRCWHRFSRGFTCVNRGHYVCHAAVYNMGRTHYGRTNILCNDSLVSWTTGALAGYVASWCQVLGGYMAGLASRPMAGMGWGDRVGGHWGLVARSGGGFCPH